MKSLTIAIGVNLGDKIRSLSAQSYIVFMNPYIDEMTNARRFTDSILKSLTTRFHHMKSLSVMEISVFRRNHLY